VFWTFEMSVTQLVNVFGCLHVRWVFGKSVRKFFIMNVWFRGHCELVVGR